MAHTDAGSQFTSVRYGERLAELGAVLSVGSVGDSFDCEDPPASARQLEGSAPSPFRAA